MDTAKRAVDDVRFSRRKLWYVAAAAFLAVLVAGVLVAVVLFDRRDSTSFATKLTPAEVQAAVHVAHSEANHLVRRLPSQPQWPEKVIEVTAAATSRKFAVTGRWLARPHVCEVQRLVLVRIKGMFPISVGGSPSSGSGNTQWITVVTVPGSTRVCDVAVSIDQPKALAKHALLYRR